MLCQPFGLKTLGRTRACATNWRRRRGSNRGDAVSYNMWFLTPASKPLPAEEWIDFIDHFGDDEQQAELVAGKPNDWRQIHVTYSDGSWSFDFERYTVADTTDISKWTDDLDFFRGWAGVVEPAVNTQWIQQYLTRVRTVYVFRCSSGAPTARV